jgi:hypothetical protein
VAADASPYVYEHVNVVVVEARRHRLRGVAWLRGVRNARFVVSGRWRWKEEEDGEREEGQEGVPKKGGQKRGWMAGSRGR